MAKKTLVAFEELTDEQVRNLTDAEIEWYKQRTALENGVKVAVDPGEEPSKPSHTEDLQLLDISGGTVNVGSRDVLFTDAAAFAEFMACLTKLQNAGKLYSEKYDSDLGWYYKFAGPANVTELSSSSKPFYSEKAFEIARADLAGYKREKDAWDMLNSAWITYKRELRDICDYIVDRVKFVRENYQARINLVRVWRKYVLLDPDEETAKTFFAAAYATDLENAGCTADDIVKLSMEVGIG